MNSLEERSKYNGNVEEEYSFKDMLQSRKEYIGYLWKFRFKIITAVFLGGLIGIATAWIWPVTYTAKLTFIVDDSKGGGGSLLSGLAGQFGLDIGGLAGSTGGLLAGDNVLQLLVSHKMIKQTLLSPYNGGQTTLADRYAQTNKLNEKWSKLPDAKGTFQFSENTKNYTRLQDSLLQVMIIQIGEKNISVSKPDKKLGFFALEATMKNEELASIFCTRLIDQASDFYIKTKTKRLRTNVDRLQSRADSIGKLLNKKTYATASANVTLLDLNPAYVTANVAPEVQERDKRVLQTIYSEIIKNLEVSRTMLMQETPTFQIIDTPDLPLKKNRMKYASSSLTGGIVAGLILCIFLLMIKKSEPNAKLS